MKIPVFLELIEMPRQVTGKKLPPPKQAPKAAPVARSLKPGPKVSGSQVGTFARDPLVAALFGNSKREEV